MRSLIALGFSIAILGCSVKLSPVAFEVDASVPSTVHLKPLESGEKAIAEQTCSTPCAIEVSEDEVYEMTVVAPDHFPAVLQFDHSMLHQHAGGGRGKKSTRLLVPMFRTAGESQQDVEP